MESYFRKIAKSNPCWADYPCFCAAVQGRNFSKRKIRKCFDALISRGEYSRSNRAELVDNAYVISNDKNAEIFSQEKFGYTLA